MATGDKIMGGIQLTLTPETERRLRQKATERGVTLNVYLERLAEEDARRADGASGTEAPPPPSPEEFERLLDELAAGPRLPPLPADLTRADLYADND